MDELRRRVDRMEREVRVWRILSVGLLGALGIVSLLGAAPVKITGPVADEVRAKKFTLVNDYGSVAATLDSDGGPGLTIFDLRGRTRVRLATSSWGAWPELTFYGDDEKPDMKLEATVWGGSMELYEAGGNREMRASLSGWPVIRQAELRNDKPIRGADHLAWGLHLFHRGDIRAQTVLSPDGLPRVQLFDQDTQMRAVLGHTELQITRTRSVEQRQASSLVLFDEKGTVLWRAP